MYVYIYIYMYMYVYIYIYIHTYVDVHIHSAEQTNATQAGVPALAKNAKQEPARPRISNDMVCWYSDALSPQTFGSRARRVREVSNAQRGNGIRGKGS